MCPVAHCAPVKEHKRFLDVKEGKDFKSSLRNGRIFCSELRLHLMQVCLLASKVDGIRFLCPGVGACTEVIGADEVGRENAYTSANDAGIF